MLRNSQHTAVGHFEPGRCPQFSEDLWLSGGGNYAGGHQVIEQLVPSSRANGADEHFGERELVHPKSVSGTFFQQMNRTLVVPIVRIEERDDDARVENDHVGQSVRRAFR